MAADPSEIPNGAVYHASLMQYLLRFCEAHPGIGVIIDSFQVGVDDTVGQVPVVSAVVFAGGDPELPDDGKLDCAALIWGPTVSSSAICSQPRSPSVRCLLTEPAATTNAFERLANSPDEKSKHAGGLPST
jgi:hypothetical protein